MGSIALSCLRLLSYENALRIPSLVSSMNTTPLLNPVTRAGTIELEDLFDVRDVPTGLLQMLLERRSQLVVVHFFDQLRQCLRHELLLDVKDVAELVQEELPWGRDLGHASPSRSGFANDVVIPACRGAKRCEASRRSVRLQAAGRRRLQGVRVHDGMTPAALMLIVAHLNRRGRSAKTANAAD